MEQATRNEACGTSSMEQGFSQELKSQVQTVPKFKTMMSKLLTCHSDTNCCPKQQFVQLYYNTFSISIIAFAK